jgi:succinoglycan biosynthesis transport protein ExoP
MRITDYWHIVRGTWRSILAVTILGGIVAAAISFPATPSYQSTTSVYFSLPVGDTATELSQGATYTQAQMLSFAELATKPVVMSGVINRLDLNTTPKGLATQVQAKASPQTVILTLTASSDDPQRAAAIADATANELIKVARDLAPVNSKGAPTLDASTIGKAAVPSYPVSPNKRRNVVLGLLAGLLLGIAVSIARELMQTHVRDDDEAENLVKAPVLARISSNRAFKRSPVVMASDPRGTASEGYRRLRINLRYLRTSHEISVVTFTSAISSEGKSTTALNFACACAEAGDRVLLIDGDLRQPAVAAYTGLEGAVGLTTILAEGVRFEDVVQAWGDAVRFDVLTSGDLPPNPIELLESEAMRALLDHVREQYDLVVIDSPPLLPVSDGALLAARSSGAIVVANVDKVHRSELVDAVASLQQVRANVLGLVINGGSTQAQSGYYAAPSRWWSRRGRAQRRRMQTRVRAFARSNAARSKAAKSSGVYPHGRRRAKHDRSSGVR